MRRPTLERFMDKVVKRQDGCWEWTAKRTRDGYGSFWNGEHYDAQRTKPVTVLAHRWAYEHLKGEDPRGMVVCHSCDNPWCVNPGHLFAGSQKDNVYDCIRKSRHRNARAALSQSDAEVIRAEYRGEYGDIARLARKYGASKRPIGDIVHRKRAWTC